MDVDVPLPRPRPTRTHATATRPPPTATVTPAAIPTTFATANAHAFPTAPASATAGADVDAAAAATAPATAMSMSSAQPPPPYQSAPGASATAVAMTPSPLHAHAHPHEHAHEHAHALAQRRYVDEVDVDGDTDDDEAHDENALILENSLLYSDDDDATACTTPATRRRPRPTPAYSFLRSRELGKNVDIPNDLITWIENTTLRRLDGGRYVPLDRSANMVRSTISIAFSHDGRFFASTHGDHTVKVFSYPSGTQIAHLEGHPRTPWTVRFHPRNSSILASGCLGCDCRVWDVEKRVCIRKHHFNASISCVSFSPDGNLLAITSGRTLVLWDYMQDSRDGNRSSNTDQSTPTPGILRDVLQGYNPFHMVDFHPSGTLLMTGEKNRPAPIASSSAPEEQQFTLRLVLHRFDRRIDKKFAEPVLVVPRAVAYNDAGIHFSPCGSMLAACIPTPSGNAFRIAVMSLTGDLPIGTVIYQTPLDRGHVTALTNLKFSSTSQHLLAGFSFRPQNPVLLGHAEHFDATATAATAAAQRAVNTGTGEAGGNGARMRITQMPQVPQVRVVDIYQVGEKFERIRSLCADMDVTDGNGGGAEDEINVAVFAPVTGAADGVVYGTQKGRIRLFQQATGPVSKLMPHAIREDDECGDDDDRPVEWTGEEANRWHVAREQGVLSRRAGTGRVREQVGGGRARGPLTRSRASSTRGDVAGNNGRDLPSRYNSV